MQDFLCSTVLVISWVYCLKLEKNDSEMTFHILPIYVAVLLPSTNRFYMFLSFR